MTPSIETEPSERPLKLEADKIKQALTDPKTTTFVPLDKDQSSKKNISFTSLAQSAIPGISARKILGANTYVTYVPDFYYIIELCQKMFIEAKNDKSIKRIEELNIHSFTLYIAHALMFVYLQTIQEANPPIADLTIILNIYNQAGFATTEVPAICSHWINAIGKHIDIETKKIFLAQLPVLDPGVLIDGFFSDNTGHLLPNFYCMLSITRITATRDTGLQLAILPATQTRQGYFGLPYVGNGLDDSTFCRSTSLRIPGCKHLPVPCNDSGLINRVATVLTTVFPDPIQNLLKVTPALLYQLKTTVSPLFREIETISLSHISPIGTSLSVIPLIFEQNQAVVHIPVAIAAVVGPPVIGAMNYCSEHDHTSRVKTRSEIINGNLDYAYQTPVVRIVDQNDAIPRPGAVFIDPQDPWYNVAHEFRSDAITLMESSTYFKRTD